MQSKMLVLIVEDDPFVAMYLEEIVHSTVEADVLVANSLERAERVAGLPIDVALCDVELPDGKTHELAAKLRRKTIAFAFVSASRRSELPLELQSAPFVSKPFLPHEIGRVLASARPAPH